MDQEKVVEELTKETIGVIEFFRGLETNELLMLILKTILLFLVCLVIKRILMVSVKKILTRSRIEKGLKNFVLSLFHVLLWLTIVIIVASTLGINTTSLIAAFSVIGLALSLAVQDSLSNLAGGINILLSRPFNVGDYIEVEDDGGTVQEIGMVHTRLLTPDNRRIVLPNSNVTSARVINYSTEPKRRVEHRIRAPYGEPVDEIKAVIVGVICAHEKTLMEPAPLVRIAEFKDSSVEYILRVWCRREDYWDLYYDLLEQVKAAFDARGIEMNYPHMNIHISEENRKPED